MTTTTLPEGYGTGAGPPPHMMPYHPPQLSPAMMNSPMAGMAGMMPPAGMHMMPSNHNMGMGMGMGMGLPFPGMMSPHGIPRKRRRTSCGLRFHSHLPK